MAKICIWPGGYLTYCSFPSSMNYKCFTTQWWYVINSGVFVIQEAANTILSCLVSSCNFLWNSLRARKYCKTGLKMKFVTYFIPMQIFICLHPDICHIHNYRDTLWIWLISHWTKWQQNYTLITLIAIYTGWFEESTFLEIYSLECHWWQVINDLDNRVASNKPHVIIEPLMMLFIDKYMQHKGRCGNGVFTVGLNLYTDMIHFPTLHDNNNLRNNAHMK